MKLWKSSADRLYDKRVHTDIQRLVDAVVSDWPFPEWEIQINKGSAYRTTHEQQALFYATPKRSWTLNSKHMDGKAIDLTLYWKGTEKAIWARESYIALFGYVYFIAVSLEIKIRWGADWNGNWIIKEVENDEIDFVHYELGE